MEEKKHQELSSKFDQSKDSPFFYQHFIHSVRVWFRYVGLPRPRPDAAEVSVRADGSRPGEGSAEAQVEVAADPAEQRGQFHRLLISTPLTSLASWLQLNYFNFSDIMKAVTLLLTLKAKQQ